MSDEPQDPDPDVLASLMAIIGCIAAGAKMPRRIQPGEDMIADAARELGFDAGEWGCAPGGRLWFARAFRQLGDALAMPPEDLGRAEAENAGPSRKSGMEGADPGPSSPESGTGLDSSPGRQSRRIDPSSRRGRMLK